MKIAPTITVSETERKTLENWAFGHSISARLTLRAKIILLAARGLNNKDIAHRLGTMRKTVSTWRKRFAQRGTAGIAKDSPRGGRKPTMRLKLTPLILEMTKSDPPPDTTHWTSRRLAKELDIDRSMVHRVWQAHGIKPHLLKNPQFSNNHNNHTNNSESLAISDPLIQESR